jgi:FkbM family methyltransferase
MGFLKSTRDRALMVLLGYSLRDKLRVFCSISLDLIPRRLKSHALYPRLRGLVEGLLIKGARVSRDGVRYVLVDYESLYIISSLKFESEVIRHLRVGEGEVFVDVGAHIGKYALKIAKTVRNSLVVAVEPNPKNFEALRRGVELNGLGNVIALNVAAWHRKEKVKLFLRTSGGHSLKKERDMGLGYVIVQAEPLDDVLERIGVRHVDWMKIDVEGAENEVLQGLRRTIERCRPKIIFESWDAEQPIKYLERYGYRCKYLGEDNYIAIPSLGP